VCARARARGVKAKSYTCTHDYMCMQVYGSHLCTRQYHSVLSLRKLLCVNESLGAALLKFPAAYYTVMQHG